MPCVCLHLPLSYTPSLHCCQQPATLTVMLCLLRVKDLDSKNETFHCKGTKIPNKAISHKYSVLPYTRIIADLGNKHASIGK